MGRGPTRCYDRRCRYAPHIACSRGCRCPSHLVAHLRCHLHRLQAVTRYASSSSSNSTDAHHPTYKNLMKGFLFLISLIKPTYPPPNHVGRPTWGLEVGEGDLRSRRRSNVQVANVGVERPTFPPLPYQGTLARCYLAFTSGPYYPIPGQSGNREWRERELGISGSAGALQWTSLT